MLALLAPVAAGCGSAPTGPQKRRVDYIKAQEKLKDWELATACPSLYPSDFLAKPKKYHYDRPTAKDKAQAAPRIARARVQGKAAGCTDQGTRPEK